MNNKIFFLIDFQNDFIQPQGLLSINNPQLINRMQSFVNSLTDNCFDSIIATMDTHFKATWDSTSESKDFPLHCEYGTKGWELAINIKDTLPVKILYKSTVNIWKETFQYDCLNQDFTNKDVYLAGLVTEICVKNALDGLLARNYKSVILFDDLTGGLKQTAKELCQSNEYKPYIENKQLFVANSYDFIKTALNQ